MSEKQSLLGSPAAGPQARRNRSSTLPPKSYAAASDALPQPNASNAPAREGSTDRAAPTVAMPRGLFGYKDLRARETATTVWYDELYVASEDRGRAASANVPQKPLSRTVPQPSSPNVTDGNQIAAPLLGNHSIIGASPGPFDAAYNTAKEVEADRALRGLRKRRFRDLEDAFTPHIYTQDERKRMDGYESIDYNEPRNLIFAEYLVSSARQNHTRYMKWVVFVAIGVAVGLWAILMFQTIDWLAEKKLELLEWVMTGRFLETRLRPIATGDSGTGSASGPGNLTTVPISGVAPPGTLAPVVNMVKGYFFFLGWSVFAVLLSSLSCVWMPTAAGSGIPDVMAYLNGIMWPRVFNLRTLFVKTFSCILSVNSGLPVGGEGPIIHIGALIGAGLPTGRSRTLGRKASTDNSFLAQFRNSKDSRDFISAGAAAGVTGAFGSPIGGLLFVMEEIATFFPSKTAWMVFVTCLSCVTVMTFVNSFVSSWAPRDRSNVGFGNFADSATVLFDTQGAPGVVPMNLLSLIPAVVLGVVFGLVAVIFTTINIRAARWRARVVNRTTRRRVLEPVTVIVLYATLSYLLPLAFSCVDIPMQLQVQQVAHLRLNRAFCADPEKQYHPLATLTLTSSYNTIRLLYTRDTGDLIPWPALIAYQLLYTIGAAYTGGVFLSSGMVIPTLVVGAIGGRLFGQLVGETWADAGMCALVGSSAFFGGLARLTYSVTVIMLEVSNDLTHIIIIMLAVVAARSVANRFCHSLYQQQLEVKCAPFLDDSVAMLHWLDTNCAGDIMATPAVTLRTAEKVSDITTLLSSCKHSGFPVVSIRDGRTFRGFILRSTLEELLWYLRLLPEESSRTESGFAPTHATYEKIKEVKEFQFWHRRAGTIPDDLPNEILAFNIDLNPYIDPSASFVNERFCISRTFGMFRQLGLRHLTVLDRHNHVVGIITRKNLIGDRLNEAVQKVYEGVNSSAQWGSPTVAGKPDFPCEPSPAAK